MRVKQRQASSRDTSCAQPSGAVGFLGLGLFALLAGLQPGCDGGGASSGAGGNECGAFELTEEEAEHACAHLDEGPFGELASGEPLANLHMLYTVTLEASGDAYVASLPFVPRESSVHAFLVLEADVPLRVVSGGSELCLVGDEPDGCDGLSAASLVDLERNQEVTLEIGPTSNAPVRLLAERQ
jgi:hypothetical protein